MSSIRLPRVIEWDEIERGDLIRVISIDPFAQTVDDRTGLVSSVDETPIPEKRVLFTPEDGVLADREEAALIILLARAGSRWGTRP